MKKCKSKKIKKTIKKIINIMLISAISISCWELGKKQYAYYNNYKTYSQVQKEKDNSQGGIFEYLEDKDYDWITLSNTAIDYPLVQGNDNEYYLTHDYLGNDDIAGSIYYDANDEPYLGMFTVIYGHSMRNGSMMNNLHYFPKDHDRFKESLLTIYRDNDFTNYKPLGYKIYPGDDTDYRKIDNMNTEDAVEYLKEECDFYVEDVKYSKDSHIIALVTCDYSIDNGRLIVFYISN